MKGMGKAIRRYREEAGITQERLAELVDISTNHLGAIEREVKTPTMETFVKLLNVLGAEPNEVLKEVLPDLMNGPMVGMVKDLPMSFKQILKFANGQIPDEKVQELEQKLAELG